MGGRTWKQADLTRLAELIEQGLPHKEIAGILGRTREAVSNRCQLLGLQNREAAIRNGVAAKRADPEKEKMRAARISASWTPERRARQAQIARRVARDHPAGSPARRKAAERQSNTALSWCPREYRDDYRLMVRSGIPAREARETTLARIRADEARRKAAHARAAALSPFERQMRALHGGAQIAVKRPIRSKSYDFTLAGGSPL